MDRISGLIVLNEMLCDGCGKMMRHPERYGYVCREGESPERVCEQCSRDRDLLKMKKDDKGRERETFL